MGRKAKDLTGKRFNDLTVLKRVFPNKNGGPVWQCRCICGKLIDIRTHDLLKGQKSCGCRNHNMCGTRIYNIWHLMIQRCHNQNATGYQSYGAKGITVCDSWRTDFTNFYKDMKDPPDGMSIDRIDNNKGYYLENCRWSTTTEQARNKGIYKNNTSGVKGVSWNTKLQKYEVYIGVNYKLIKLGFYSTLTEASAARKRGECKYWGK